MTGPEDARDEAVRDERPLRIEVRRGTPTPEELAAVIAVVSESYAQEAAEAVAPEPAPESAWRRSARALRTPLRRGFGWGRFTG
ncbi:acyl-CoA carboxylase subunit epsilon [Microbacterium arborescens]|uniref:acyl-CoA carboxylase subunit epsilon n=1 Tax=Microbacterium arborescens TaxID=33883 RepID=UPI0027894B8C|nr:acyl-CoA carboxylase subunit epsilon [Microbacterium arborescens]MDQ1215316.1 hypothetical protein [Microbacterium arborescens]